MKQEDPHSPRVQPHPPGQEPPTQGWRRPRPGKEEQLGTSHPQQEATLAASPKCPRECGLKTPPGNLRSPCPGVGSKEHEVAFPPASPCSQKPPLAASKLGPHTLPPNWSPSQLPRTGMATYLTLSIAPFPRQPGTDIHRILAD